MGSPECEWGRGRDSENENDTTLTHEFLIKQTEVTNADWRTVVGTEPPNAPEPTFAGCTEPECPLGSVTWFEALWLANQWSKKEGLAECYALGGCTRAAGEGMVCSDVRVSTGTVYDCKGYRLPTEAEWEYSARAGTRSATFAGDILLKGDLTACARDGVLTQIGWYCANSGRTTHSVRGLASNGWGLFDVAGNQQEWVWGRYSGEGYGSPPRVDPDASHEASEIAITRGGGAFSPPPFLRSAWRDFHARSIRSPGIGFRLARTR